MDMCEPSRTCVLFRIRKNLFTLGTLEAQGCKFSGADGGINITKCFMTILKGERSANLYKMIGSVFVGDVSTTMEKDITRYWHMRFGYMSERDLQALYNKRVLPGIKYCKPSLCKFCIMGR